MAYLVGSTATFTIPKAQIQTWHPQVAYINRTRKRVRVVLQIDGCTMDDDAFEQDLVVSGEVV